MRAITLVMMFVLAGCVSFEPAKNSGGLPKLQPFGQSASASRKKRLLAAYNEEIARARGASITKWYPSADGSFTCING